MTCPLSRPMPLSPCRTHACPLSRAGPVDKMWYNCLINILGTVKMNKITGLLKKCFVDPPEDGRIQFLRSLFVGLAATLVDMGVLVVLKEFLGLKNHTFIAATIAFIAGLLTNYLLSTFWAFRGLNTKSRGAEFTIFAIISVIGLLLNNLIIMLFEDVLGPARVFGEWLPQDKYYIIGKVVATVIVFIWNFGMRKILLYTKRKPKNQNDQSDLPVR